MRVHRSLQLWTSSKQVNSLCIYSLFIVTFLKHTKFFFEYFIDPHGKLLNIMSLLQGFNVKVHITCDQEQQGIKPLSPGVHRKKLPKCFINHFNKNEKNFIDPLGEAVDCGQWASTRGCCYMVSVSCARTDPAVHGWLYQLSAKGIKK